MEEKNNIEKNEIYQEVMRIVNAIHSKDVSSEMEEDKEKIYRKILDKIEQVEAQHFFLGLRIVVWKYLAAACIISAVFLGVVKTSYHAGEKALLAKKEISMVEAKTPLGIIYNVSLADGTKVTLKGGSRLTYPIAFGKERKVTLEGEGYFEVAKDKKHPFIVNTNKIDVVVLGTKFSLSVYDEDEETFLTLAEGEVQASTKIGMISKVIKLKPNQQLVLNNSTGDVKCKNVNPKYYTEWRDGSLYFRDLQFDYLLKQLERRFDVHFIVNDSSLLKERYFAQFENNENLEQILTLLSYRGEWSFVKEGNNIRIIKNTNAK